MPVVTNVFRRGGSYYFRVRVPDRLVEAAGRRELWRSLRTSQANVARRRGTILHGLTERLWRDLERAMSHSESKALIDAWLRAEIDEDAYLRSAPEGERYVGAVIRREARWKPDTLDRTLDHEELARLMALTPDKRAEALGDSVYLEREVTDRDLAVAAQRKLYADASARLVAEDEEVAAEHVRDLFERRGVPTDPFSERFEIATRMMMRAHADLWRVVEQRDAVGWREWLDDDPAEGLLSRLPPSESAPPIQTKSQPQPARLTFFKAAEVAIREMARIEGFKAKRVEDYQNAVSTFIDWAGEEVDLEALTSEKAGAFKNALTHYPSNVNKRLPYRELKTFAERLAAAEGAGEVKVLSPVTVNGKYLTPLKRIVDWHRESGLSIANPFDGVRVRAAKQPDARARRRDFTIGEVKELFALPLFTGSEGTSGRALYRPGSERVSDWRFWVPLICLFSGMRLNEACGIALSDFKQEGGVDYIHVRDETEGQSLKSDAARRKVPLHAELIALGLPELVTKLRGAGGERLFDELVSRGGYFSAVPSKFLNDVLKRIADPDASDPGRLVFHSSRHTVVSRLRAAEVRMDVAQEIVGHEKDEVHAGYGGYDIPTLKAAVDKIVYPGLDLTALRR